MIEIEIPSDIQEIETKFIGPLSLRQFLCGAGFIGTVVAGYFIIGNFTESGLRVLVPLVLALPWALIGFYKPYGMKFEQYFLSQLYTTIIPPKKRLYKSENLYEQFEKELMKEENPELYEKIYQKKKPKNKKR